MLCFSHFALIVDVVFSYNIILDAFPARCGGEMPAILMDCRILGTFCVDRLLFLFCSWRTNGFGWVFSRDRCDLWPCQMYLRDRTGILEIGTEYGMNLLFGLDLDRSKSAD